MSTVLLSIAIGFAVLCLAFAAIALSSHLRSHRLLRLGLEAVEQPRQLTSRKGDVVLQNGHCRDLTRSEDEPLIDWLISRCDDDAEMKERLDSLKSKVNAGGGGSTEVRLKGEVSEGDATTEEPSWYRIRAYALRDSRGSHLWAADDITARFQMELALREEQSRFVDLLEHAPIGFYSVDETGRFLFVNETLAGWLGEQTDAILSRGVSLHDVVELPPGENLDPYMPWPKTTQRSGEVWLRAPGGERFLVLITQDIVWEPQEGRLRTRSVVRHLSLEQASEDALVRSRERFERFFKLAPTGLAQLDGNATVTEYNDAFLTLLRSERQAVIDRPFSSFVYPADRARFEELWRQAKDDDSIAQSPIAELRLGEQGQVTCTASVTRFGRDQSGKASVLLHLSDLTEQKQLEAQFVQGQKMQAVGQLAGGIAHDFNNLLTAMIGFSDLLLQRHRPGDQSFADVMQIKQNANRAANLVRQLLAFSRQQTLQPKVVKLTDILAELAHLLRRLIGAKIELKMVHGRDLWSVKADQGQLEQVIINLAVNARDAMQSGGTLSIKTANLTLEQPMHLKGETAPAGEYMTIVVEDTGCGISDENIDRIFDPFFSTKGIGEGTGLGLSTVYGIVKQTGGFVSVDSKQGEGTTFTIYLPRHEAQAPSQEESAQEAATRDLSGMGTVLLVEDEEAVRAFSSRALRNKGYDVIEAGSGEAALEIFNGQDPAAKVDQIDLVVTDVVMPRLDGPALVQELRKRCPTLKVVFISGYAEDSFRQQIGQTENVHFLPKPFSLKQLAGKVKEVMDTETSTAA